MTNNYNDKPLPSTLAIIKSKARKKCRKESKKHLKEFECISIKTNQILSNTLGLVWNNHELMATKLPDNGGYFILSGTKDVFPEVDQREKFESVLASYVVGITSVKKVLYEGSYVQASCLIRQELEVFTQLSHILNGTRKEKKAPNIQVLNASYKKTYTKLSGVSHLANHKDISDLAKGDIFSSEILLLPLQYNLATTFRGEVAMDLLALHYLINIEIIRCFLKYINKFELNIGIVENQEDSLSRLYEKTVELVPDLLKS